MKPSTLLLTAAAIAGAAFFFNGRSTPLSAANEFSFRITTRDGSTRDIPALVVGSNSRDDISSGLWPFSLTYVTTICARGGLIATVGPRDALALNGHTSRLRSGGRIVDRHGDELPIIGAGSSAEIRMASFVRPDASTEEINAATNHLLSIALGLPACR